MHSKLSDEDEYNVESDNHIINEVLLQNQLVMQAENMTLTPYMIKYITVAINRFHIESVHGPYRETNLAMYKVFTNYTDTPGDNRVDLAILGWSPSYP